MMPMLAEIYRDRVADYWGNCDAAGNAGNDEQARCAGMEVAVDAVAQIIANNTDCTLAQARNLCGDLSEMIDEGMSPDEAAREIVGAAVEDL